MAEAAGTREAETTRLGRFCPVFGIAVFDTRMMQRMASVNRWNSGLLGGRFMGLS
ncbi:MAG: hypothetical protein WBD32_09290 [Acidobacteriaceae bacterium]